MSFMIKILIVDDEAAICKGISKIVSEIEGYPFDVRISYNGKDALKEIRRDPPDILITDIVMEEMSGLELIEKIKSEGYEGLIFILSGHASFPYARAAIKLKPIDYLLKPIDKKELISGVIRAADELALRYAEKEAQWPGLPEYNRLKRKLVSTGGTMRRLADFLEANCTCGMTLQRLAHLQSLNEKYVCNLFSNELNTTFLYFFDFIRLEKAAKFLVHTHMTVEEAAENSGFGNVRQFYKVFKKRLGVTPNGYRESFGKEQKER